MTSPKKSVLSFRNYFITGMLALLPLAGTILVVKFIVSLVNDSLLEPILQVIQPRLAWAAVDEGFLTYLVKGVLFFCILSAIVLFGMLVRLFFVQQIFGIGEKIVLKVPFINKIYGTIQQMIQTILFRDKDVFNKVVLVEYPRKGIYIIGLLTSSCDGELGKQLPEKSAYVFIPTTPNPTSGFLIMVPRSEIQELNISVEEAMKIIISGGVLAPGKPSARSSQPTL